MADAKTEKQKVKEITDKLEEGLKELLATVEGYEDFRKAVTYVSPVPISFEDIPGDSKGYFSPAENRIGVSRVMPISVLPGNIDDVNGWLYHRIRMCIWKQWKKPKTKLRTLLSSTSSWNGSAKSSIHAINPLF